MAAIYAVHAVWRLWLYAVYGVLALTVYRLVFSLNPPLPGYIALGIVLMAVGKDLFDHFKKSSFWSKLSYKFVDHNPFNIVLLWGLVVGAFTIPDQNLFYAVVGLASLDMVMDGYVDFKKQPSTHVMLSVFIIVAAVVAVLHHTVGLSSVVSWVWNMAQAVTADPVSFFEQNMIVGA